MLLCVATEAKNGGLQCFFPFLSVVRLAVAKDDTLLITEQLNGFWSSDLPLV